MPLPQVKVRRFRLHLPQCIAAALLAVFLLLGIFFIVRHPLASRDAPYARCGGDLWLGWPAPNGTSIGCGDVHDGLLAYRLAGLPVAIDHWRNRPIDGNPLPPHIGLLARLPFLLAGCLLGGCLWWVARRLYGDRGGYAALAFFLCSPALLRASLAPNADVLAALGLFGGFYACIGIAHAQQGPRRKWRPRIALLAVLLGLTIAAHLLAAAATLVLSLPMALWLALGRRLRILPLVVISLAGAAIVVFVCAGFSPRAVAALFQPSALRVGLSLEPALHFFASPAQAGQTLAAAAALLLYLCMPRARYFGNTAPLLCAMLLMLLAPRGVQAAPWLWAQAFLINFVSGVFADAYETRFGRWAVAAAGALVCAQVVCCLLNLNAAI